MIDRNYDSTIKRGQKFGLLNYEAIKWRQLIKQGDVSEKKYINI